MCKRAEAKCVPEGGDERAHKNEARFRAVAKATTDLAWDWNLRTNKIWWDEDYEKLFGYAPPEQSADAEHWLTHVHPEDAAMVSRSVREAIEARQEYWTSQYRFLHGNGSVIRLESRACLVFDKDDRPVHLIGGVTDVTNKLLKAEQSKQAERLESIGQLTGGIAHDFNNLLTVILGNTELLLMDLPEDDRLRHMASMTQAAATRAAELTHRLLAFARRQPLEAKPTDVNLLLRETNALLRRTLTEDIEIELSLGDGIWSAMIDPAQLEKSVLHLCVNARDATPVGGRLTIETANCSLDEEYAKRDPSVLPGSYVMIAISDSGSGITPENISRVFDPFFTTKEVGKGTGLGLSMVYGFIKQSNGHIRIYSELGHGTTIRMYLPYAEASPTPLPQEHPEAVVGGTESILLVEDDAMVRQYAEHQLRDLGYSIVSASNGPDALAMLSKNRSIDLLFTDIIMPGMTGHVLADTARASLPDLKVLYTSGYTEKVAMHQSSPNQAVHFLNKPYRRQELARKVRKALSDVK
jgi:PAS domain S-box-containing protein